MKAGWQTRTFREVLEIRNGRNQREVESAHGEFPIYGSAGNVMGMATDYICEAGTTIIGRKGNINSPIYSETRFWNVDTAFGLTAKACLDSRFLYYFCLLYDFGALNRGTTIPSLVKSELLNISIPLPPLPEQQRIVAILDEAFAGIATARAAAEQNRQNARALFESHLQSVFSQRGDEWAETTIDKISTNLDNKRIPITKSDRKAGEYPYYGASGIVDYVADYIFDGDTLLVSEDGANLLARSTPIAFSVTGKYWVNNHAHILKFERMATQRFVEFYFASIRLDEYITGAAQPKLNQKALNSIPIPIPTHVARQAEIVARIESVQEETQRLEALYQRKLEVLDELKQSLLHQAFSGAL